MRRVTEHEAPAQLIRVAGSAFNHGWITQCDVCGGYAVEEDGERIMPLVERLPDCSVRIVCIEHFTKLS